MEIICILGGDTYIIDPIVTEDNIIGAKIILEKSAGEYHKIDSIRFKLAGCKDVIREHVPIKNGEVILGTVSFTPLDE